MLWITLFSLAACKSQSSKQSVADPTALKDYGLGTGSSAFEYIMPLNLKGVDLTKDPEITPCVNVTNKQFSNSASGFIDQTVQQSYSYDWTEASLEASLNIEAKVLGIQVASAKVYTSFRAANINSKLNFASVTNFESRAVSVGLKDYQWAPNVKSLVDEINALQLSGSDPKTLERKSIEMFLRCGDRFAAQVNLGSKFSSSFRITFKNTRNLLNFLVKAEAQVAQVKKTQESSKYYDDVLTDSVLEVSLYQKGGNQTEFDNFQATLGEGTPSASGPRRLKCFTDPIIFEDLADFRTIVGRQLERCYKSWALINQYLSNQFYSQISKPNYEFLEPLDQVLLKYDEVGLLDKPLVLPPLLLKRLEQINEALKTYFKIMVLLDSLQHTLNVTELATEKDQDWKTPAILVLRNKDSLSAIFKSYKDAVNACITSTQTDYTKPCNIPDIEWTQFKDILL